MDKGEFSHDKIFDTETGLTLFLLIYKNKENVDKSIQIAVAPEYGSNIVQFNVGGREVFYTDKQAIKDGKWTGCFVLWPLPNRYDNNGRKEYEFEGQTVSLEDIKRKEGNQSLIHGLVDDQVWKYNEPVVTKNSVNFKTHITITKDSTLYKHFPYESELVMQYTVSKDGVEVMYSVTNKGKRDMPSVFGLHPYYALLGGRERTTVTVPAHSVMKTTNELLPTGEIMDVAGTKYDLNQSQVVKDMMFDDVWTDLEPGRYAYVEYPELNLRISQITSEDFTHIVLYTQRESDLGFICLEPQTGSTNAINLYNKAMKQNDNELARIAHVIVIPPAGNQTGKVKFVVSAGLAIR